MPIELRQAHHANDHAVMKAYGLPVEMPEPDIVAELMKHHQAYYPHGLNTVRADHTTYFLSTESTESAENL